MPPEDSAAPSDGVNAAPAETPIALMLRQAASERRWYLLSFLLIIVANLLEIGWVRLTGLAVEEVASGRGLPRLAWELIGLAALIFLVRWCYRVLTFFAGRRIERRLRSLLFGRILAIDQSTMDRHRTGDLVSRIVNDVSDIRLVLGSGFIQIANNIIAYAATITAMILFFPSLALAAILPFIPLLLAAKKITASTHERSFRSQERLGDLSSSVEETVAGIEVIRSCRAEAWQARRFAETNDRHFAAECDRIHPESLFMGLMGSVVWFGIVTILVAAGLLASRGYPTPGLGDLATFIFLFVKLVWPTVALGWIINVIQRGLAAGRRILPFMGETTDVKLETMATGTARPRSLQQHDRRPDTTKGGPAASPAMSPADDVAAISASEILLDRVSFRYPFGREALFEELTLAVRRGEWIGIAGPSASGKTTLARLIAGLRRPDRGRLLVRGDAPAGLARDQRRRLVQLVAQNATLFSLSIAENLALAGIDPGHPDLLIRALEDAAFESDLAHLPNGLETLIGERGLTLSGGQRQRIALARALLADPEILLMDDIISAVDVATERKILEGLARRRRGRTTLFITHRLRLLASMDRVMVLEKGRIVADGSLDDVLRRSAWLRAGFEAEALRGSLDENGESR